VLLKIEGRAGGLPLSLVSIRFVQHH